MSSSSFYSDSGVTTADADAVESSKNAAAQSAQDAQTHANTASTKASEASDSAIDAAASASTANNSNVQAVAANLGGTNTIGTVAGNIADINTVAGMESDVDTVANASYKAKVETVADSSYKSDVETVAASSYKSDVETVADATYKAKVETVANSTYKTKVEEVAADLSGSNTIGAAVQSASDAATSASNASTSETNAASSESTAATHASNASTHATTASGHADDAEDAKTAAQAARDAAQGHRTQTGQDAAAAAASANSASSSASDAASSEANAAADALVASNSADSAKIDANVVKNISSTYGTLNAAINSASSSASQAASSASTASTHATTASGHASTAATHAANLGSVAYQNLTAIAESKSTNAVDVFVYDTSKDSDGGAWRHRTQGTSWYNEALNTSTRGATKKFPAVAVIVAEDTKVTIYDGDDPSMPMWRVTNMITGTAPQFWRTGRYATCVSALNGKLFFGLGATGTSSGLAFLDFVADKIGRFCDGGTADGEIPYITSDADTSTSLDGSYQYGLVNVLVNDLAVTVLPNAPIDPDTGLPVPTIAVATDAVNSDGYNRSGSIIKDDGTVIDVRSFGGNLYHKFTNVDFDDNGTVWWSRDYIYGTGYAVSLNTTIDGEKIQSYGSDFTNTQPSSGVKLINSYETNVPQIKDISAKGKAVAQSVGLNLFQYSNDQENSMVSHITSSYNTGWMNGDIKLATLMDTTAETISAPELVTNGDFSSFGSNLITNGEFPSNADGWTLNGGDWEWDSSGRIERVAGNTNSATTQNINIVDGKTYRVRYDVVHSSGDTQSNCFIDTGSGNITIGTLHGSGSVDTFFTAEATTTMQFRIYGINDWRGFIDNVRVEEVVGWEVASTSNSTVNFSNGALTGVRNSEDIVQQTLSTPLTVGETYNISFDITAISSNHWVYFNTNSKQITPNGSSNPTPVGSYSHTFTATSADTTLFLRAGGTAGLTFTIDNISLRKAVADRSVNNNGLNINGNIVKSAVATGAELMGYGFSPSPFNNLKVPYDSDHASLGSYWTFMTWVKRDTTAGWDFMLSLDGASSIHGSGIRFDSDQSIAVCPVGGHADPTRAETNSTVAGNDLAWQMLAIVCDGQRTYFYRNGKLLETVNKAPSLSLPDSSYYFTVGAENEHSTGGPVDGRSKNMALLRLSASQATPEQIAKIYRDEKPLFQAGAKCTLYGDYDAVNALAYDEDTGILHAGTTGGGSSLRGRSDFKGLQRVDNTTYGVAVALSAANGLVVEE